MALSRFVLVTVIIYVVNNCVPIETTDLFNKITGFVKTETDTVKDKLKGTAQAVGGLFHPQTNQQQPAHPQYPAERESIGQGSFIPEEPSTNPKPNVNIDTDVHNNEGAVPPGPAPNTNGTADGRSLLAFKGCPEGERKDRAGKCRSIS